MKNINNKSLEQLIGPWQEEVPIENYNSSIEWRRYQLYRTPLEHFSIDDVRFMILQQLGLEFLIPKAVGQLEHRILVEGNYYRGDLLNSIFQIPASFRPAHRRLYNMVLDVLTDQQAVLDNIPRMSKIDTEILKNRERFLKALDTDKG